MAEYGFGEINNLLFSALIEYPPNFLKAEALIENGANIHAVCSSDEDENMLAQIILGYPHVEFPDSEPPTNEYDGRYLPSIIQFFLNHGFDVSREKHRFGADCLRNLTWSSYDRYILDGAKLLLDAGASYEYADEEGESVFEWVATKVSLSCFTDGDDEPTQLFCTMWDILDAHRKGQDYHLIDSCLTCEGLRIDSVLIKSASDPARLPIVQSGNVSVIAENTYLLCEGTALRINTHAEVAVDYRDTDSPSLVDISDFFAPVIGQKIVRIRFPDFNNEDFPMANKSFVIDLSNGVCMECGTEKIEGQLHLTIQLKLPD